MSYLFVAVLLSGLGNGGTLLALTKVVVAEEVEERLSPGGLEEDMAPAPYDDDDIVEEFDGL